VMHGREKSDSAMVAMKPANNAGQPAAEWVERRAEAQEAVRVASAPGLEQTLAEVQPVRDRLRAAGA